MSRWFRYYDGAVDDPKVQRLPPVLFKFWVNSLCLASRNGGEMPAVVDMAFSLRMTEKQVVSNLKLLVDAGLVDEVDGKSTPHNWNARQFKSDDSKERVKQHRQRQVKQPDAVTKTVTRNDDVTVDVTPPEQSRAETDSETEQKDIPQPQAASVIPFPIEPVSPVKRKAPSRVEPEGFEEFYSAFPLHKARPAAAKAFAAALKRASPAVLLAGAQRYAAQRQSEDPKFTKHPATWLNQDCWLDEEPANDYRAPTTKNDDLLAGWGAAIGEADAREAARGQSERPDRGLAGEAQLALPAKQA